MIYLSESTMEKYNRGYMKASTILKDYLPENNKIKDEMQALFDKAKGIDTETETEISKPRTIGYYKLKPLNLQRRKGLVTAMHTPKKDFRKIGIITFSGKPYSKIMGYLYTDENNHKYMIPENEYKQLFGL